MQPSASTSSLRRSRKPSSTTATRSTPTWWPKARRPLRCSPNGVDTKTNGADLVIDVPVDYDWGNVDRSLGATYANTTASHVRTGSAALAGQPFFDQQTISDLTSASPKFVANLGALVTLQRFSINLRESVYGKSSEYVNDSGATKSTSVTYCSNQIGVTPITNLDVSYLALRQLKLSAVEGEIDDRESTATVVGQCACRWNATHGIFHCDGRPLTNDHLETGDHLSPVLHLLLAMASCYAETCRALFGPVNKTDVKFEVIATGQMSSHSKHRLTGISVVVLFLDGVVANDAVHIVEEATPLCPIANALGGSKPVVFECRTVEPGLRRSAAATLGQKISVSASRFARSQTTAPRSHATY